MVYGLELAFFYVFWKSWDRISVRSKGTYSEV
jgi:hypothetical protein